MKKRFIFYLIILFLFIGVRVNAQASLNVSTGSTTPGGSFTASVSMYNAAAWNIHVNATGPVSGCVINVADASADAMNVSNTFSATCTATGEGVITVTLSGDTTDQNGNTSYLSGSRTVTVAAPTPVVVPPTPSNPTTPSNPQTVDTRSGNNNLKSIKVEGYDLVKSNDTTYTLSVKNSVDKITIKAEKEDTKATLTGDGLKDLKVGENKFSVVVTAENGVTKTYTVIVTRRDTVFTLNQLKDAISDSETDEVDLVLDKEEKITTDDLNLMKDTKKTFHLVKYDEEKKVIYEWIIDGLKIKDTNPIDITVLFDNPDRDKTRNIMDYVEGLYFKVNGKYPNGTKLKVNVGELYKNNTKLYNYLLDKTRKRVGNELVVKDGYVTVEIDNSGEYYLTPATFEVEKETNIFIPICIVEGVIILLLLVLLAKKKKKKENVNKPEIIQEPKIMTTTPPTVEQFVPVTNPTTAPDFQVYPQ